MLLVPWILPMQNDAKIWKIAETLTYGYSSESTQWELSDEYQHDRVEMVFKCILLLWMKKTQHWKGYLSIDENSWHECVNPYAAGGIWPLQNNAKELKNDWNSGKWVLIWEYSARAIQWIPTWQGFDGFQKSLRSCALDQSSHSIGRVNLIP